MIMYKRLLSFFLGLLFLLPAYCDARHRKHKKLFPETKDNELKYEYIGSLNDGRMRVLDFKGKYGYIDSNLTEVIPYVYDYVGTFCNGMSIVQKGKKYGIIDTAGNELMPCEYDEIITGPWEPPSYNDAPVTPSESCLENYILVRKDTLRGVYDIKRRKLVVTNYQYLKQYRYKEQPYRLISKGRYVGLAFQSGEIALPIKYNNIWPIQENRIPIEYNKKWGFLDSNLQEQIDCIYDGANGFNNGLAAIKKDGKWGYINRNGQEIIAPQFDEAYYFANGVAPVVINGKYGLIDKTGKQKIACKYDRIFSIAKMGTLSVEMGGKRAIADIDGHLLTDFAYDDIYAQDAAYIVSRNNLKGLINRNLVDTTPIKYDGIMYDSDYHHLFVASIGNKWGSLDSTFSEVIPFKFDAPYWIYDSLKRKTIDTMTLVYKPGVYLSAGDFSNGLAKVENSLKLWGYINKKGKEVIKCAYSYAEDFNHGMAIVSKGDMKGVINTKGKLIEPFEKRVYEFTTREHVFGIKKIEQEGKYGFTDKKGNVVVPPIYAEATLTPHKMIRVKKDSLYGYMNTKGRIKIPLVYSEAVFFEEGPIQVKKNGRWFLINKRGKIKTRLDSSITYMNCFYGGLAPVMDTSNAWGYVNTKGVLVIPCTYRRAYTFLKGGAAVRTFEKNPDPDSDSANTTDSEPSQMCIINKKGKIIIPMQYQWVSPYCKKGLIAVENDHEEKLAYINRKNKLITPYMFDKQSTDNTVSDSKIIRVKQNDMWTYMDRKGRILFQFKAR